MSVAKFGRAELTFAPMLDPVREEHLAQYLHQFCDDALRRRGTEAALAEAAVIVRSVLADAAHRWNATIPVAHVPPTSLTGAFAYLSLQDRLHVSRVCRSWRSLALSEPRLWNRVALKPRLYNPNYDSNVIYWYNSDFVQSILDRSTGETIDLSVWELYGALYVDAVLSALPNAICRLRSLRIEFIMIDPEIDRLTDALSAPAPYLEQLTVHALSNAWGVMNGRDISPPFCAPRLRSVSITGVAFSASLDPLPSVSNLDLGRSANRVSWAKHLFALFPNAVEVSLPDFGGALDFPSAPAASHVIQSLTIGHEGANNPHSFLPLHWHLARIAFISLRWASQKTARELLAETFPETATPRVLSITGFGTRIALSDAAGAVRRECDLMAKDFTRLLSEPALFATVTDLTLVDRCAPDAVWKLVSVLPALTQLTILIADSGQQKLLTRADSTRGKQVPALRHPTLETVVLKEDPEWDTSKNVPKGPYPPTVFAPEAERVLRARVGLVVAPDGSSSPRVVSRGVLIENADQAALKIVTEEAYRAAAELSVPRSVLCGRDLASCVLLS